MQKWFSLTALVIGITFVFAALPVRAETNDTANAILRVVLDGQTLRLDAEPVLVDKTPYLPLRKICEHLDTSVTWDSTNQQAFLVHKNRSYRLTGVIRSHQLMVSMNEIAKIFGLKATYDPVMSAVLLGRKTPPTREQLLTVLPSYDGYDSEDVYWLSRIVEAEANGESYESRLGVASVILNRMNDGSYPDTVKEVVFDKKFGVQFTPVANGRVYNEPSTLSFLAALDALEGKNNALGALFFMNPKHATSFWMQENRQYAFTIGGHSYYY